MESCENNLKSLEKNDYNFLNGNMNCSVNTIENEIRKLSPWAN